MAEEPKKTAARDISDLKKKLGLKTSAVGAVAPPAGAPNPFAPPAPNPFASPGASPFPGQPGLRPAAPVSGPQIPGVVAPPPIARPSGQRPAMPTPGVAPPPGYMPDARRDPFAAPAGPVMPVAYAPGEIVVIDKDDRIEKIGKRGLGGRLVRFILLLVCVFIPGYSLGRIWSARHEHNYAIKAAGELKAKVDDMALEREKVKRSLAQSLARTRGLPDPQFIADLQALNFQAPDSKEFYRPHYEMLDDKIVHEVVDYYANTEKLALAIQKHVDASTGDMDILKEYTAQQMAAVKAGHAAQYGIVIDTTAPISVGLLAEVGEQLCKDGTTNCDDKNKSQNFQVRTAMGSAPWQTFSADRNAKDSNRVLLLDQSRGLFPTVAKSGPVESAWRGYQTRSKEIIDLLGTLDTIQKDLDQKLGEEADAPKMWVFPPES